MNAPNKTLFAGEVVIWIQIDGPKSKTILLGCHGLDSLEENLGAVQIVRCRDLSGPNKWKITDSYKDPDDLVEGSITSNINCKLADYLETITCPFRLYVIAVCCGRLDRFNNRSRAWVLDNANLTSRSLSNLVSKDEQAVVGMEVSFSAVPPLHRYFELSYNSSNTVAAADTFVGSLIDDSAQCASSCGNKQDACGDIISASGADFFRSTDGGVNFVTMSSAAQLTEVRDVIECTNGTLVASGLGPIGIEISTDDGATWAASTSVIVPTAASPNAVRGHLLRYHNDFLHYAAGDGNVYRSGDCGVTWTLVYAAVDTTAPAAELLLREGELVVVFQDGVILTSANNGQSYTASTAATVNGANVTSAGSAGAILNLALDNGTLICSKDLITWIDGGAPGGTSADTIVSFFDSYNGILTKDDKVYQTIDGGTNWAEIGIAQDIIQAHVYCNQNHVTLFGSSFAATLQPTFG